MAHVPAVDIGRRVMPMTIAQMRCVVGAQIAPDSPRSVPTDLTLGAALAEPLRPQTFFPPSDTSAMDGYAVCGPGPWHLLSDTLPAGSDPSAPLADGTAVAIATGALVPPLTSSVLRLEHSRLLLGGRLVDTSGCQPGVGSDIRRRGENWHPGCVLATPGTVIGPAVMSAALSADCTAVVVRGPLHAHVVITGDEISTADTLAPGRIRDSLGPVLPELLRSVGYRTTSTTHLSDRAFRHDAVIATTDAPVTFVVGGTGQGVRDYLRSVLADHGAEIIVDQVLCRPGGSQLLAILPDGRVVVGLPGNPMAAVAAIMTTGRAVAHTLLGVHVPAVRGRLSRRVPASTGPARVYPTAQRSDDSWDIDCDARTAHLGGLINRTALAVVDTAVSSSTAEIIRLPTTS